MRRHPGITYNDLTNIRYNTLNNKRSVITLQNKHRPGIELHVKPQNDTRPARCTGKFVENDEGPM